MAPCGASHPPVISIGEPTIQPIGVGLYAESGLDDRAKRELERAHETAQRNLRGAFGALRGDPPIVIFCRTAACKIALGAPAGDAAATDLGFARDGIQTEKGFVRYPTVIVSGPFEATPRILTHELVHAEMKAYAPYDATPTWFNEGMATLIANEPSCGEHPLASNFDIERLDTKDAWQAHLRSTGTIRATYCEARNRVLGWTDSFANAEQRMAGLKSILESARRGGHFVVPATP
jgi:hypothetical protein